MTHQLALRQAWIIILKHPPAEFKPQKNPAAEYHRQSGLHVHSVTG